MIYLKSVIFNDERLFVFVKVVCSLQLLPPLSNFLFWTDVFIELKKIEFSVNFPFLINKNTC